MGSTGSHVTDTTVRGASVPSRGTLRPQPLAVSPRERGFHDLAGGISSRTRRRVGPVRRLEVEARNRALLESDLAEGRTVFDSRPHEAYVQFSNFCNMSCVMCHNGANPPLQRMSPQVLRRVEEELAPSLSVIIPHGASEPLIVGWDDARRLALENSIDLRVTTNVQFLDRQRFEEVQHVAESLFLSVDSHIPDVYARIRRRSRPDRVFANLRMAGRLADAAGLECLAQVVFMTENGPTLADTVRYFGSIGISNVNVLQLVDGNGQSGMLDPLLHFSPEYVASIKQHCIDAAHDGAMRLIWNVDGFERHDFRSVKVAPKLRKDADHRWVQHMRRRHPGYCASAAMGVQVRTDGLVTPCCFTSERDLPLGHLGEQGFDEIWNGPAARDLRRAMQTWDYPEPCATCHMTRRVGTEVHLPFVGEMLERLGVDRRNVDCVVEAAVPGHMTRTVAPPSLKLDRPRAKLDRWVIALAEGGQRGQLITFEAPAPPPQRRIPIPDAVWKQLRPNVGYWWAAFGIPSAQGGTVQRSRELRCLIRHQPHARIAGSPFTYSPATSAAAESAPPTGAAPSAPPTRPSPPAVASPPYTRRQYRGLLSRLASVVRSAVPHDATVLVVSKGDPSVLDLDCRAWHFPASPDGKWIGHNPADGEAAVAHLEAMRARGAEYLLLPATARWWLTYYTELAEHLQQRYTLVTDEPETCAIFALGDAPALYGRARERRLRHRLERSEHLAAMIRDSA